MEPDVTNLFRLPSPLPRPEEDESVDILARARNVRVERIVSTGQASPPGFWYDQSEHEWVLLVKGAATLRFEQGNKAIHLTPGSYVNIAAHERHRVEWTAVDEETVWLAVFY